MKNLLNFLSTNTAIYQNPITEIAEQFGVKWHLLIAQIINFCIVALIMYKFAFKPIMQIVSKRQKEIIKGINYAEEMKLKLFELEKKYEIKINDINIERKIILDAARDRSNLEHSKICQEAILKSSEIIKKAKNDILLEKQNMIVELKKEFGMFVVMVTEKVINKNLSTEEKKIFTKSAIKAWDEFNEF